MVALIAPEPGFDYASAVVTVPRASRDSAVSEPMQESRLRCQQDRDGAHANAGAPHGAGAPEVRLP
jgi:hypothetical protein